MAGKLLDETDPFVLLELLDRTVDWLLEIAIDFVLLELLDGTAVLMLEELVEVPDVFVMTGLELDGVDFVLDEKVNWLLEGLVVVTVLTWLLEEPVVE